jgi:hypothetical protein
VSKLVMLNGRPDETMTNGLRRMLQGASTRPLSVKRWRWSMPARPQSTPGLAESEGKLEAPSVSLFAHPSV